jgi:GxxExxY protein
MSDEVFVDEDEEPNALFNRITNDVIGAVIAVHRTLGPGYAESVYQKALEIEFRKRRIFFERELEFPVLYDGQEVGTGRVDFLVEQTVVVELKAVAELAPIHTSQIISYLKASKKSLAIIINFNSRKLIDGIKRVSL